MHRVDKILLVSQTQALSSLLKESLNKHSDYKNSFIQPSASFENALSILSVETFNLVLVDAEHSPLSAIEMLIKLRAQVAKTPIIILNEPGHEKTAVHCLSHGAQYYLVKDSHWLAELPLIIEMVMTEIHHQKNLQTRLALLECENENLRKTAILDESTFFYTANHFDTLLSRELKRASRYGHHLACLIVDVKSHARESNDAPPVNELHAKIGLLLKSVARSCDIWARLSDGQYAALLPNSDTKATKLAVRRLKSEMSGSANDCQLRWGFAQYDKKEINNEAEFLAKAQLAVEG